MLLKCEGGGEEYTGDQEVEVAATQGEENVVLALKKAEICFCFCMCKEERKLERKTAELQYVKTAESQYIPSPFFSPSCLPMAPTFFGASSSTNADLSQIIDSILWRAGKDNCEL